MSSISCEPGGDSSSFNSTSCASSEHLSSPVSASFATLSRSAESSSAGCDSGPSPVSFSRPASAGPSLSIWAMIRSKALCCSSSRSFSPLSVESTGFSLAMVSISSLGATGLSSTSCLSLSPAPVSSGEGPDGFSFRCSMSPRMFWNAADSSSSSFAGVSWRLLPGSSLPGAREPVEVDSSLWGNGSFVFPIIGHHSLSSCERSEPGFYPGKEGQSCVVVLQSQLRRIRKNDFFRVLQSQLRYRRMSNKLKEFIRFRLFADLVWSATRCPCIPRAFSVDRIHHVPNMGHTNITR